MQTAPPATSTIHPPRPRRRSVYVAVLYALALLREFRWTLLALALVLAFGTMLYSVSLDPETHHRLPLGNAMYAAWMAMLAQPVGNPTEHWYLTLMCAV